MSAEPTFFLQWRGQNHGPWSYVEIHERLREGEIHSLYQIRVDDQWQLLRDYIETQEAEARQQRAAERAAQIRAQEAAKQSSAPKHVRGRIMGPISRPNPFANPPPVFVKNAPNAETGSSAYQSADIAPTCWMAVAAFVVSCCSFVPYLNLISWLPSLVLGHLALQQIQRQPELEGRGLALGALMIAYTMLAFAFFTFLMFPDLFYRIFPIAG